MSTRISRKWAAPLFCLAFGFVYLVVFWIGGNPVAGVGSFVVMVAYGLLLLVDGRSEVVRILRDQASDEMWRSFDERARLFAFFVLPRPTLDGRGPSPLAPTPTCCYGLPCGF